MVTTRDIPRERLREESRSEESTPRLRDVNIEHEKENIRLDQAEKQHLLNGKENDRLVGIDPLERFALAKSKAVQPQRNGVFGSLVM